MNLQEFYDTFLSKRGAFNFFEYFKVKPGVTETKLIEGHSALHNGGSTSGN
jgi:hypothetical protein